MSAVGIGVLQLHQPGAEEEQLSQGLAVAWTDSLVAQVEHGRLQHFIPRLAYLLQERVHSLRDLRATEDPRSRTMQGSAFAAQRQGEWRGDA